MLNTTTTIIIVLILLLIYVWRISKFSHKAWREFVITIFLVPALILGLFWHDIFGQTSSTAEATTSATTTTTAPNYNEYEQKALQLLSEPAQNRVDMGAPEIRIVTPADGTTVPFTMDTITVTVEVKDDTDTSPLVFGAGEHALLPGYNPIPVVAMDKDGNIASTYVVIYRDQAK